MRKICIYVTFYVIMAAALSSAVFAGEINKLNTGDECIVSNEKIIEDNSMEEVLEQEDCSRDGAPITTVSAVNNQSIIAESIKGGLLISWNKVKNAEKYELYRKTGRKWQLIKTTGKAAFLDSDVSSGKTYTYGLKTKVDGRFSDRNETEALYLKSPTFSLVNGNVSVSISWDPVPGASKYSVFRKRPDGTYKKLTTTTALRYKDTEVGKNYKTYSYYVRAVCGKSASGYSEKSIKHVHIHSYTQITERPATYDVCGLDKYLCR